MNALAVALLALVKSLPAAARLLEDLFATYSTWKKEQNKKTTDEKDIRNDSLIDNAASGLRLCSSCPFARHSSGQDGNAGQASPVPAGGSSGS